MTIFLNPVILCNGIPIGSVTNTSFGLKEYNHDDDLDLSCCNQTFSFSLTAKENGRLKWWVSRLFASRRYKYKKTSPQSNRTRKKQRLTRLQRRQKRQGK